MSRRTRRRPRCELIATSVNMPRSVLRHCGHQGWRARWLLPTSLWPPGPELAEPRLRPLRTYATDLTWRGPQKHPPNRVKGRGRPFILDEAEGSYSARLHAEAPYQGPNDS